MEEKVPISLVDNTPFVWNANDVVFLREKYRIVGALIGCLPRCPYQNSQLGLPLKLLKEEAALLVQKGIAHLIHSKPVQKPTQDEVEEFQAQRNNSYQEQVAICREGREKEIKQHRHLIVEGKRAKRKKLLDAKRLKNQGTENVDDTKATPSSSQELDDLESGESDDDLSVEAEIDQIQIPNLPESASLVQIVTANPAERVPATGSTVEWCYPSTTEERLRCRVFSDLWEKGYHLTSGAKFGGDFLVYPGDPLNYHSFYIAVCLPYHRKLSGLQLISYGRLGSTVKKNVMLCCIDDADNLVYHTLQWTHVS